jgi:GTPase KRas protein
MREQFIRGAGGFVLVYAVNDEQSFKSLNAVREQVLRIRDADTAPMVLVANKV